jgi:5,5'-dehydrodivanillate O-demethylase
MLSALENDRLSRVGPGTPMGQLLRRYWHPVAGSAELAHEPTKAVLLLGEKLVLYRDRSGALGLVGEACAHRRVNLLYGIPEQKGLRCPYHGWLYNEKGQCLEQPAEAPDSTFKERIKIPAYPVQELGGLVWAYLGPEPAPLLPRWDVLVRDNVIRDIGACVIPCNWLQTMENSMDPVHVEWLHGWYAKYVMERRAQVGAQALGVDSQQYERERQALALEGPEYLDRRNFQDRWTGGKPRRHLKIGFDVFEHGLIKRRVLEGHTEADEDWQVGHPVIFPNILRVGNGSRHEFQIRVPMDDTHTWHLWYTCNDPGPGAQLPKQAVVPLYQVPVYDKQGWVITDFGNGQDAMAWITQGGIADRTAEKLGESDKGIILYRRLLNQQLQLALDGGDPMNVFRDAAKNAIIGLPQETRAAAPFRPGSLSNGQVYRYSPKMAEWEEVFAKAAQARAPG